MRRSPIQRSYAARDALGSTAPPALIKRCDLRASFERASTINSRGLFNASPAWVSRARRRSRVTPIMRRKIFRPVVEPLGQLRRVTLCGRGRPRASPSTSRRRWSTCRAIEPAIWRARSSSNTVSSAAHGHRHLGGGGRCRRALIRSVVNQGCVGFVPDRANQWNVAVGGGAHHFFFVEAPQSPRSSRRRVRRSTGRGVAPRRLAASALKPLDRRRDLFRCPVALDQHRP